MKKLLFIIAIGSSQSHGLSCNKPQSDVHIVRAQNVSEHGGDYDVYIRTSRDVSVGDTLYSLMPKAGQSLDTLESVPKGTIDAMTYVVSQAQ
jgi:hypothetical protein